MYIVATFEQTIFLELVIAEVEKRGITKQHILAVPLNKRSEPRVISDSLHHADGFSMVDLGAILGTVGMLLGAIYGFVLAWGPIIWGIIGALSGCLIGYFGKWLWLKRKHLENKPITSETVLLIQCPVEQCEVLEKLLWDHLALGVSKVDVQPRLNA
ncbi:hypothetical protein [Paenibacillus cremeus]|uniref:Uncharacterized protein n=1 Tax=Paenibacillus cremeus TaxID=2163881 RepID=A0A559KBB4_9BACL|nr:hypothetical protein [Paenibacillus cremeus]TVY09416.1 hypothetical protein FPZ49_13275 [Paenibacillus cremeus]